MIMIIRELEEIVRICDNSVVTAEPVSKADVLSIRNTAQSMVTILKSKEGHDDDHTDG